MMENDLRTCTLRNNLLVVFWCLYVGFVSLDTFCHCTSLIFKAFVASPLEEAKSGATARRLEKFTAALPAGSSAARDAALDPRALWVRVSV